jgi:hypothetical protein
VSNYGLCAVMGTARGKWGGDGKQARLSVDSTKEWQKQAGYECKQTCDMQQKEWRQDSLFKLKMG